MVKDYHHSCRVRAGNVVSNKNDYNNILFNIEQLGMYGSYIEVQNILSKPINEETQCPRA